MGLMLISLNLYAQGQQGITDEDYVNTQVEMADKMRAEGKIYVLVGIIGIVLGGILVYVVYTDKKISALERQFKDQD